MKDLDWLEWNLMFGVVAVLLLLPGLLISPGYLFLSFCSLGAQAYCFYKQIKEENKEGDE